MAKVSVILPIYNVSQYLRQAIDSVIGQTLKDIEIICVDDGSTDDSLDIIQEYAEKDPRIVVITGPNGGYGKAVNKGLDRATGEYIGILEPDDYLPPDMMKDLYNVAKENDLDFVKSDFYRFTTDENGQEDLVENYIDPTKTKYGKLLYPCNDPSLIKFTMNIWSGIYRREFLEEYHIRCNTTPGASYQDNGFFFQTTVYAKRAMIIEKPYYKNRRDNPNSSVNNKEKVYCANIEYDFIRDILMRDQEVWERFKHMYNWKKYQNYMFTINRIALKFKYDYVIRMGAEFKRSFQLGEFVEDDFTPTEWGKLSMIMQNPDKYYQFYIAGSGDYDKLQKEYNKVKAELDCIKSSTTYKVGRIIMAIPCAIKRALTK